MKINMKKLSQYISTEDILEFNSDQECMDFFNIYDYQNLKSVKEMKIFQGKYGFNIGNKRYHIARDLALDVYEDYSGFTEEELIIINNGVLLLMDNAETAKKLLLDANIQEAIDLEIDKLMKLNTKICEKMEECICT